ncbi:ethanolamine ammonia-lyase reactivating factor EutA [Priestia endophytica]|uniref:Ethanolamine utilization protein EutA n=1 Tax=Priestia endophytica DSM 13796 TaxID=1121089 RepID=A0A1I5YXM6_9BACI|nr:ethanolamine ammonia-lyase reactivating factor EutA [Priestia endophytica]KYG27962.1 hypothetical protein AZF06_13320 [Priestia endophytica]SFQ49006.1 ethanolamine utilization protein EutA [Priestia endophytica DSM 13796]
MSEYWIKSIGIDIGTSTTKVILSRLLINERKDGFSLPVCHIIDREVTYTGSLYETPLETEDMIHIEKLKSLLSKEYQKANVNLKDIKGGAVIITGETARKENAESIIHYLADKAGDFVVATAGDSLEGILAGKGSGAMKRSEEINGTVANVDIGGGTANVAFFQDGKAVTSLTFHVGGRLVRLTEDGEVQYIAPSLFKWLSYQSINLKKGDILSYKQAQNLCQKMSEDLFSYLLRNDKQGGKLLLTGAHNEVLPKPDEMMISGGVGAMMNDAQIHTMKEAARYGDIGPLLASVIPTAFPLSSVRIKKAVETNRATVIGAGMQSMEVSGATVHVQKELLPIRNIPLLKVKTSKKGEWSSLEFLRRLREKIEHAKEVFDTKQNPPFALTLLDMPYCSYVILQEIAQAIHEEMKKEFQKENIVVICEDDVAKALGQALKKRCAEDVNIVCIDGVQVADGDYIDLGMPIGGEAISVSVKTLAFHQ